MPDQPLPQNIEAEQAVLGAILTKGCVIKQVLIILTKEDFYLDKHKKIYEAMVTMHNEGKPIDIVTICDFMKAKENLLEDVGGSSYIAYLTELVPTTENVEYYSRLVKEASKKRSMVTELTGLGYKLREGEIEPDEAILRLNNYMQVQMSLNTHGLKPVSAKDLEDYEPVETIWGDILFPYCITQVNADPGLGKTTLFYNLSLYGALGEEFLGIQFRKKLKVLYVDMETSEWIRKNKLKTIHPDSLPETLYFLKPLSLKRDFLELLALCKRERYDLVVLDTQSRIFAMEQENDNAEANYYIGLLRQLVNETGCSIVLIHHPTKSDHKGVYSGRGASAIAAAVDVSRESGYVRRGSCPIKS